MNEEELFCKLFPDYAVNGTPLSPYFDFFESGYEQAENRIEELEKENANLKEEIKNWKDEWQEQVQKATDEGYARTLQTIQLSKAKEIIKKYLAIGVGGKITQNYLDVTKEAEQFLNSEVEK